MHEARLGYAIVGRPYEEVKSYLDFWRRGGALNHMNGIAHLYDDRARVLEYAFYIHLTEPLADATLDRIIRTIPPEVPLDVPLKFERGGRVVAAGRGGVDNASAEQIERIIRRDVIDRA